MKYQALLFDLDGTLINSIDLWGEASVAACAAAGIGITMEMFREWYKRDYVLKLWLKEQGYSQATIDAVRADRDVRYMAALRKKITWLPGASEILEQCLGRIPLALVTNSHRRYVEATCERLPLEKYFPVIVTDDDMGKFRKPHPHGFFLATETLGVDPKKCLSIGDRFVDVETSHASGMSCCIVQGAYTTEDAMKKAEFPRHSLLELASSLTKA
jgi:HAD superfamily hydrolase (TIGR01549 family)